MQHVRGNQVVADVFYDEADLLLEGPLEAALHARFPIGSGIERIKQFIADNDGVCAPDSKVTLLCNLEIPSRKGRYSADIVTIDITHNQDAITALTVHVISVDFL